MNWIVVQLASIWAINDVKTRSPTTSQLLRKTQQNLKDHSTHLFHDLVATSEVEALLQQASPHYRGAEAWFNIHKHKNRWSKWSLLAFHHQLPFDHFPEKQKHLENILALKTVHCLPSFIMFCIYILCYICTLSIIPISYLLEFLSPMSVEQISYKTRLANELKYICGSLFSLCQTFHPFFHG